MRSFNDNVRRWEFEARIFISLTIVLFVCVCSYVVTKNPTSNLVLVGKLLGWDAPTSLKVGYLSVSLVMAIATFLRMWAGSTLSSNRVMAFRVQSDSLMMRGMYGIVRNPIYCADLVAMFGFALCLPPTGVFLPLFFYLHYLQLVKYEERALSDTFKQQYLEYVARVPRLVPNPFRAVRLLRSIQDFEINMDGIRNNALYLGFVVGFVVAAYTSEFFYAVLIGLPAVFDWAAIHTKKGMTQPKPKKVFADILYAQCWEDPGVDRIALNIGRDDVVFAITSGGCNVLTFLLDNPRKIISLDLNPRQNHLLELKICAFKTLSYEEMLEFIGVKTSDRRLDLYHRLQKSLSVQSRTFWDNHGDMIARGIMHCGRFERYMGLLRLCLRCTIGRSTIRHFFEDETPSLRKQLYQSRWQNWRWWILTRVLLSRTIMSLLFDKAFFQYLDTSFSFGKHFAETAEYALTELPTKENYFLSYILLGNYLDEDHLPPYLRKENFEIIRSRVDRIEVVTDTCDHYFSAMPEASISKFYFTNIFEWMSPSAYEKLLQETIRVATDGAVMTYRNLLVTRERPQSLANNILSLPLLALALHQRDLSFIYKSFVVEQIQKEKSLCRTQSQPFAIVTR
jgi:S-adenosylmethionine-diacylglycerol 3-amino-3-carboxypropyl transferase